MNMVVRNSGVRLLLAIWLTVSAGGAVPANAQQDNGASPASDEAKTLVDEAKQFLKSLESGDYQSAYDKLDPALKSQLSVDKEKEIWNSVVTQMGPLQKVSETSLFRVQNQEVVDMKTVFLKQTVTMRLAFDSKKRISGWYFLPAQQKGSEQKS
jgi:hypothetical protein